MADTTRQKTVVIADYDYGDVDIERAIIEAAGLRLITAQCKSEDDVIAAARDADAIIAQYATVGARAISALTRCEVIARYGTGTDIADVDAATQHGILVTNVPNDWCENEVADHAMALLLAAARKIIRYDQATRAGVWRWQTGEPIHRLSGGTLGLLSFGAIAQAIGRRAAGFGLRVIASDQALFKALSQGWIAGAGLDDIEEEPAKLRDWTPANPLFGLDNVIITPHAAYYSEEAIRTVRDFAASEVVRVLTGQPPLSAVNGVQVASARRAADSRLTAGAPT